MLPFEPNGILEHGTQRLKGDSVAFTLNNVVFARVILFRKELILKMC